MRKRFEWRPSANVFVFVLLITAGNLALYQKPFWSSAVSVAALPQNQGWLQLLSLQISQVFLLTCVLLLLSTLSIILVKLVASVLAMMNATALYFMLNFNVALDSAMIASILNTNAQEAFGTLSVSIIGYLFVFGLLPTILIWWTKVRRGTRIKQYLTSIATLVTLVFWLFPTSADWLWYDEQKTELTSKILPWSYVVNTAKYFKRTALDVRAQTLLPRAQFKTKLPARKQIVVLMIGESARAENFALYGYNKDTNPFTASTSIVALPVGLSCATNTIASIACILSHAGSKASAKTRQEPLPSYLTRHGVETIFRTNTAGPPPVIVTTFERPNDILLNCDTSGCPDRKMDAALNWKLADILKASTSNRIFLTIHHNGSHGPAYFERYPAGFEHFRPECKIVEFLNCTQEEVLNAYDNSIRYTDFVLADLIAQLKLVDADTVMIYTSDHGESFGENGFYVHGTPKAIAPKQQREVPFLVWMSDGFKQRRGLSDADIIPPETFPHDFPFHSVMGAFGMRSEIYKPEYDIFNLKH
ncbi:MAG: sulfatase-like hydrolase/transferase [Rhizobiales bacterium]|nr:sulfatase-like hydrolase/transferase [Hyphomicrobiales bacterium]NRB15793.1 sulfatase-like hydrolase/transferase [Hyphomicrobiales bacterium]